MPTAYPRLLGVLALVAPVLTLPAAPPGEIEPCELLTMAQVTTVLPESKPGYVAANGTSLIKGVKSYQCSYINPAANILTVVVTVAADDAAFAKSRHRNRCTKTIARWPSATGAGCSATRAT